MPSAQHDKKAYGCDVGLELIAGCPLLERDSCKGDSGGQFYKEPGVAAGRSHFTRHRQRDA
jgi:hypothetical protein